MPRLPAALEQILASHLDRLARRSDCRGGVPWELFRTGLGISRHRVIWPDLARRLAASVPPVDAVPLNTVYGIITRTGEESFALSALLNTRWLTALARLVADPARGGFCRFNARVVRSLPVPPADSHAWTALTNHGRRAQGADDLVADVFELSPGDRRALARVAPDSR
jgi:hypothetical protein